MRGNELDQSTVYWDPFAEFPIQRAASVKIGWKYLDD